MLAPDESELYAYYTGARDNRVVRMSLSGGSLGSPRDVITGIPRNSFHNGGRLRFGPDDQLYVSTGDAGAQDDAQDRDALAGKILRLTPGGDPSDGNPFDNEVFSWGHRNVQGLAFDDAGRLWASEFGNQRRDELNLVEIGQNYGWPVVEGRADDDRFVNPKATWATDDCSPSGIAIAGSTVLVAGLKGQSLYAVAVDGADAAEPQRLFEGEYGRLRTIEPAPDGSLWLTTSNTDGRTDPGPDDDRILRVTV
ncbi:MAG: PQQ-dependent sugar dehydrogenase [Nocardioidaceae bacterium]|nr:PQQ-dependent sugar dehydrogenase [Nocardioidaceae bacterium]